MSDNQQSSTEFDQLKAIMNALDKTKSENDNGHNLKVILDSDKKKILESKSVTDQPYMKKETMTGPCRVCYNNQILPEIKPNIIHSKPDSTI